MTSASSHLALQTGNAAAITGGVNGIGLASALRFASLGMNVLIADRDADQLKLAEEAVQVTAKDGAKCIGQICDIIDAAQVEQLAALAKENFGNVSVLMNNAGAGINPGKPWENVDGWKKLLNINLWGVIHGVQSFVLQSLETNDFYILCPDNDVTRKIDERRIQRNADDLIKNRPALFEVARGLCRCLR